MTAFLLFLKPALAFLRGLPWQLWAGLALLALAGLYGHWRYNAGQADTQSRWDAQEAVYAQQRAAATLSARDTEARHRADYAAAAARFLKDEADAKAQTGRIIADLRSGNLRLLDRFKAPACGVSAAPGDTARGDGAGVAYVSVADQEFLLRLGADADRVVNRLTACQAVLQAR